MVASQKFQIGMIHARKIVTVIAEDDLFRVAVNSEIVAVVPRTTAGGARRYKAYKRPRA
jgi:uncharacterized protein YwlG (UPF0340 family)